MLCKTCNIFCQAELTSQSSERQMCRVRPADTRGLAAGEPRHLKCASTGDGSRPKKRFSDKNYSDKNPGTNCTFVNCGPFSMNTNDNSATISITGTLIQETNNINITSKASIIVPDSLIQIIEEFNTLPDSATFTTQYEVVTTGAIPEFVIIIISVCISLIVLLLIIIILVKKNFFKHTTIMEQEESRKPLTSDQTKDNCDDDENINWQTAA